MRVDRQPLNPYADRHDALHARDGALACAPDNLRDEAAEFVLAPGKHLERYVRETRCDAQRRAPVFAPVTPRRGWRG